MRYDQDAKQKTRERVLLEASKVMRHEGAQAVGVASVMARAGMTHGGFYAHFRSKNELLAETVELMIQQIRARYARITGDLPAADALRAYVTFYLSPQHRDNPVSTCPMPVLSADAARLGGAAQAIYSRGLDALLAEMARHLRAAGVGDPDAVASSVAAELVGAMSLARAVGNPAQSDLILARSRHNVLDRLGLGDGAVAPQGH